MYVIENINVERVKSDFRAEYEPGLAREQVEMSKQRSARRVPLLVPSARALSLSLCVLLLVSTLACSVPQPRQVQASHGQARPAPPGSPLRPFDIFLKPIVPTRLERRPLAYLAPPCSLLVLSPGNQLR